MSIFIRTYSQWKQFIFIYSNKNQHSCSTLLQSTANTIINQEKCSLSGKHVREVNRCCTVLIIRTSRVKMDFRWANLSTWITLFILLSITGFAFAGVDASDRSMMESNEFQGEHSIERIFSTGREEDFSVAHSCFVFVRIVAHHLSLSGIHMKRASVNDRTRVNQLGRQRMRRSSSEVSWFECAARTDLHCWKCHPGNVGWFWLCNHLHQRTMP